MMVGMEQLPVLRIVGDVIGLLDTREFRAALLTAVRTAVACDWISLNDVSTDPAETVVLIDPPFPPEAHELFARLASENPLVARHARLRDGRAYRFSDVVTSEELHATALYREFYGPIGLEHQIAFTLPHGPDRVLALALSRRDSDFTDAERDTLNDARPFLIQCYRNAIEHSRVAAELEARAHARRLPLEDPGLARALADRGVTRREAEVLSLVATGRSHRDVSEVLGLSERTIQKHLQACYAKLGVHDRVTAVAAARGFAAPGA
ncbi:MAG: hypothetical protein JWM71_2169 [Solirubrobacteraceae bacterium]|nr:hypothetical protein [Solirubrobacteraceae bacterium]